MKLDFRFSQWVRATWLGWGLGLILTIAGALAGDAVGLRESQALVGLGMGAGVGIMQARAIRGAHPRTWVLSSVVGLAAPFLMFDLARAAGFALPFSLYLSVALGGCAAGVWQAILLRRLFGNAWMWAPASIIGWSLAAASAAVADVLPRALGVRGLAGAGMYLSAVLAGGLILALVTGLVLTRLDQNQPERARATGAP